MKLKLIPKELTIYNLELNLKIFSEKNELNFSEMWYKHKKLGNKCSRNEYFWTSVHLERIRIIGFHNPIAQYLYLPRKWKAEEKLHKYYQRIWK